MCLLKMSKNCDKEDIEQVAYVRPHKTQADMYVRSVSNITVWRPSVRLSVCTVGAYST